MKKKKILKAPRRLGVKPPKVMLHGKDYNRRKQKKELLNEQKRLI